MSRQKQKGTSFETLMVTWLRGRLGDARIERMPLTGAKDRGDIAGVRTVLGEKVAIECKSHSRLDLAGWVTEARIEMGHADAHVAVVFHKRRGKGQARDQYVTMLAEDFAVLLGADRQWE